MTSLRVLDVELAQSPALAVTQRDTLGVAAAASAAVRSRATLSHELVAPEHSKALQMGTAVASVQLSAAFCLHMALTSRPRAFVGSSAVLWRLEALSMAAQLLDLSWLWWPGGRLSFLQASVHRKGWCCEWPRR